MSIIVQHRRDSRANCEANTPASGELWFDTTLKALRYGDGATLGGFLAKRWGYEYPLSPPQITANQNDYAPADFSLGETLFLNSDAARSITGIAGGFSGARRTLINRGAFDITLVNASVASLAANRFLFESDVVLRPNGSIVLQYSVTDSRWMRAEGGIKFSTVSQELLLTGAISPAQIVANQNDYAPANVTIASILRLNTDASRNITGIVDARDGVLKTIINVGANPIVLQNQNAGSAAANRFDFGADVTLAAKQSATIRYDGTDARWKLEAATAGAAVAAGAVTAQTLAASSMGAFVGMINGTVVPSVAASALTIALKTLAGADPSAGDPVYAVFRNATAATGDYVVLTITAATSLVISSGSSMGVPGNNIAFRLWVVGFNDAGTFRLGAINCRSGNDIFPLAAWGIASSTAEGGAGAADSAQTFYTGVAVAAKAYLPLGYLTWETGLAAAGTWSAVPTRSQLFGHGVPLPGMPVQELEATLNTVATGTTTIPFDDTIPQSTEGDQYLTKTMTPQSAANLLRQRVSMPFGGSLVAGNTIALFQDAGANAISAICITIPGVNYVDLAGLENWMLAGATAATTFKVRAGLNTAGTLTVNGAAGARFMGGSMVTRLQISEIMT